MQKGVLVDLTRCIGCRGCQVACKGWNERKAVPTSFKGDFTNPTSLSANTYTRIRFVEGARENRPVWTFVKDQCMHCKEPACVSACPVGALVKTENGPVNYIFDRCIGCRYCMVACPFDVPKYEWNTTQPWIQKCTFCADRLAEGQPPSCVKTCPTTALFFGDYDAVVKEAEKRLAASPKKYVNHIYGKDEVGGTSWIYLSGVSFDQLGFRMNLPKIPLPSLTWEPLSTIPVKVAGIVAVLGTIAYIRNRKVEKED